MCNSLKTFIKKIEMLPYREALRLETLSKQEITNVIVISPSAPQFTKYQTCNNEQTRYMRMLPVNAHFSRKATLKIINSP
jgi:hypothetical protein